MSGVLNWLARTPILLTSFTAMLLIGAGFGWFADSFGGTLLDEQMSGAAAQTLLDKLTAEQQDAHFWITVLLDTAYPIAYGAFFIGLLSRLSGDHRSWAIWPSAIGVDCDFAENITQALALSGNTNWLWLKDFLTPLKFGCLIVGVLLIVVFASLAVWRRFRST